MKNLLLVFSLVALLSLNQATPPIPNFMKCAQSVMSALDVLGLMGEHIEENNFNVLEASVRAFAFQITLMKRNCNIEFNPSVAQAHLDQNACLKNTQEFYSHLKPLVDNPQDVLIDTNAFQNALDSFTDVLDTCGVNIDDAENEQLDRVIEETGGIDLAQLLPIMEIYNNQRGGFVNHPKFRGGLELEDS